MFVIRRSQQVIRDVSQRQCRQRRQLGTLTNEQIIEKMRIKFEEDIEEERMRKIKQRDQLIEEEKQRQKQKEDDESVKAFFKACRFPFKVMFATTVSYFTIEYLSQNEYLTYACGFKIGKFIKNVPKDIEHIERSTELIRQHTYNMSSNLKDVRDEIKEQN